MLRLTPDEAKYLINMGRSQNVIPPGYNIGSSEMFAFVRKGVAMLSGVLQSEKAIRVNIKIMRAFMAMSDYLLSHASLSVELAQLRERVLLLEQATNNNLDAINDLSEDTGKEFETVYDAIAELSVKLPQLNKPR